MNINELNKKDLGCILYCFYIDNYMEDDFSFDNGKMREQIESYYEKLEEKYTKEELKEIEKQIQCYTPEGTDYDSYEFKFKEIPNFFLQVTSMIDYDNNKVDGYSGNSNWCDVGMFFVDYINYRFEDLNTIEKETEDYELD